MPIIYFSFNLNLTILKSKTFINSRGSLVIDVGSNEPEIKIIDSLTFLKVGFSHPDCFKLIFKSAKILDIDRIIGYTFKENARK